MMARIEEAEGHFDAALDALTKARQIVGGGNISLEAEIIRLEALLGRRAEAERHLTDLQRAVASNFQRIPSRNLANVQLGFGNRDRALDFYEEAINERDPAVLWLAVDPRVDELRSMPRFQNLLARLGIPDARSK
jgi:tetratricopeptide (TPR) repeat protein